MFRALGKQDPPQQIVIDGVTYQRQEVFKHDSWAATALYAAKDERIVCKLNRVQPVFGISMLWLGRFLARREAYAYRQLGEIDGIPAGMGQVYVGTRCLRNAVAHHFLDGQPLQRWQAVNDDFFPRLQILLRQIHALGFAYVDLHKRENILVGIDGQPYLIDFQISFQARRRWLWRLAPCSWVLSLFQASDEFCLAKHVRNHRPDQLDMLGLAKYREPPWWIRLHRWIAVPFREARRKLLVWIGVRDESGKSSSECFAEHAFRQQ